MQFRGMSRSHLFLIELIIAVLFFSFAGAITVQVFSRAHDLAESTTALNSAVIAAQTAAETDKTALFENIGAARGIVYFNRDWEITKKPEAVYNMTSGVNLEEREAGTMAVYIYTVAASDGDKIIYRLHAKKYYSGKFINEVPPDEVN